MPTRPNWMNTELERTEELFRFLQGVIPDDFHIADDEIPRLTEVQAWTAIWYLGNQYWQVPNYIERCGVCGDLFDTRCDGTCLDYDDPPYHFCGGCESSPEYFAKLSTLEAAEAKPKGDE